MPHRLLPVPDRALTAAIILCVCLAAPAVAQTSPPDSLGATPFSHMHMLFERTIFKVDVLTLDVCVDPGTASAIASIAGNGLDRNQGDSIAARIIAAPAALGRIRFERNVSLGQFLDGIREQQKKAVDAGLLEPETFRMISDSLPVWFDFLEERGIHDGDDIVYVFHGDSIRTRFLDPAGNILLDRSDVGEQRRTSVLATWFAPRSDFRRPLLESLGAAGAQAAACSTRAM